MPLFACLEKMKAAGSHTGSSGRPLKVDAKPNKESQATKQSKRTTKGKPQTFKEPKVEPSEPAKKEILPKKRKATQMEPTEESKEDI